MEESGSEGLDEQIVKEAKGFFADVDAVCSAYLNPPSPHTAFLTSSLLVREPH